ncbi:hypothetical protein BGX34_007135 [Mortierella sp. NVP85]|nr:hypothetical protein BGX34_007135 [Mortierella sp. NVP85]
MNSGSTNLLHQQWLKDKIAKQESITMVDFATEFNYFCEVDAHEAFTALLSKSFVRQAINTILLDKYGIWKRNEGARFWASRATKLSTTRTAGKLVAEGEHVAEELFRENRESATSSSTYTTAGKASLGIQLSDLLPYDQPSTTPPGSPAHVSTGTAPGSSTLGTSLAMSPAATLSSPRASSPTSASSASSASAPSNPVDEPTDTSLESEQLLDCEREELLRGVDESGHPHCDWKVDNICMACRFTDYRRACIHALVAHLIKKTDIGDLMAIIGVFAPAFPTKRMLVFFSQQQLKNAFGPKPELPDIDIDDASIMKAVRLYLKGRGDEAEIMIAGNKKLRIMLETLLEYLPLNEDKDVSESTFATKYVAPIIQAYVDGDEISSDL